MSGSKNFIDLNIMHLINKLIMYSSYKKFKYVVYKGSEILFATMDFFTKDSVLFNKKKYCSNEFYWKFVANNKPNLIVKNIEMSEIIAQFYI